MPTKVHLGKAVVFPVVMYGHESWTIKKAECWRIDTFELWCWRRLLRVPWTVRRSNQFILKEISPEYSLDRLMLKFQYFGHLMWRTDSLEKTLMLGVIEGGRRRGQERMRWLDGITDLWTRVWVSSRSWWRTGKPGVLQSMGSQRVEHKWVTERYLGACMCVKLRHCVWLFTTPWTVACQAPLSMGFLRQEFWSGLPFPSSRDLLNPEIKPTSLLSPGLAGMFFTSSATWEGQSFSAVTLPFFPRQAFLW